MIHQLHKPLTCSLQLQLVLSTIIKMLLALQHGSTTAQCFSLACMRPVFNYVNQKKGHLQHHCQLQQIFLNSNTGAVGTISLLHFPYRPLGGIHFLRRQPRGEGGQSNFYFTNSHIQKNYLQKGRVQKRSKMLSTQKMDAPLV